MVKLEKKPSVSSGIKEVRVEIVDSKGHLIQSYNVPIETSGGERVKSLIPSTIRMMRSDKGDYEVI